MSSNVGQDRASLVAEIDQRIALRLLEQEERLNAFFQSMMNQNAGLMKQLLGNMDTKYVPQSQTHRLEPTADQLLRLADVGLEIEEKSARNPRTLAGDIIAEEENLEETAPGGGEKMEGGHEETALAPEETEKPDALAVPSEEPGEIEMSFGEKIISSKRFEMVFAILIILCTINMCVEAEYRGDGAGHALNVEGSKATNDTGDVAFKVIEVIFGILFTIEVVLKLVILRFRFWTSGWNVFDFFIIAISWLDMAVDMKLPVNPMLLRLVRLVRLLRMLDTLRQFEIFDTLFMMVKGIKASLMVLIWVIVLLFPVFSCCALAMNYLLADFVNDTTKKMPDRLTAYKFFGTYTRAMFSIFELTFASWMPIGRFLYHQVDEKYMWVIMGYKLVLGIAVLRVVYGVFLHVTFACAASDEQAMIEKKHREVKKYSSRIGKLFERMDVLALANGSETGQLSREDFEFALEDHDVRMLLSALEVDVHDARLVFDLTDDGDGSLDAEEMINGFSRLKGHARSVDIAAVKHQLALFTKDTNTKIDIVLQTLGCSIDHSPSKLHRSSHNIDRQKS